MPGKKTKYTQIPNARVRNSTFKRRLDSLCKKAHELSVLCDVDISVIIHNPDEGQSMLWPNPEKVMSDVERFLHIPEGERLKKMVLQEKLLMDKMQDMADRVAKLQQKNAETESGFLMNQALDGKSLRELELRQLNGLYHLVDEKLKMLQTRSAELSNARATTANTGHNSCVFSRIPTTTVTQYMREDISCLQNNLSLMKGLDIEPETTKTASYFIGGNQGELLHDFHQMWPIFDMTSDI